VGHCATSGQFAVRTQLSGCGAGAWATPPIITVDGQLAARGMLRAGLAVVPDHDDPWIGAGG
jgi:hypothetical protein